MEAASPASSKTFADTVTKCDEVMEFFRFSHDTDSSFRGTVCFELSTECGRTITRTVRIKDSHYVQLYNGMPQDGKVDCKCSMPFNVFTKVYWGELHPVPLLMNGTIQLHGWTHGPVLKRFSTAFDFSTEKWDTFYAHQAAEKTVSSTLATQLPTASTNSSSSASTWFSRRSTSYMGTLGRIPDDFKLPSAAQAAEPLPESALQLSANFGMVMRRVIAPSMRAAHPHAFLRSWHRLMNPTTLQKTLRMV